MQTVRPAISPESYAAETTQPTSKRRLVIWLVVACGLALAIVWLPYLLRSNDFVLPILDDHYNPEYTTGFYDNETNATGVFRWTQAEASVQLPTTLLPTQLTLELAATRPLGQPAPTVGIFYNGQLIKTFQAAPDFKRYTIEVPTQWTWTGGTLQLEVNPALLPDKTDNRERGVAFRGLEERAERTPPVSAWLSTLLIIFSLFWASWRVFPVFLFSILASWQALGFVFFTNIPVIILSLYWNFNRIEAAGNFGWYILVAIWLTLVLAQGERLFPTDALPTKAKFGHFNFNGGFLASRFELSARFYRQIPPIWGLLLSWGLPVALISLTTFGLYSRVFSANYGFYWDDYHVARPWSFSQLTGTFTGTWDPLGLEPQYYRPLTASSFALDYSLWGLNPFGYHLTNMLLETGVALLGFWFTRKLGANRLVALLTTLFLVWLPFGADTTVWVSERSDSLALLFMLVGLLAFVYFWENHLKMRSAVYLGANSALVLALGSKETGVVLPILLVLWAWAYSRRAFAPSQLWAFVPPFVITGLYLILRSATIHNDSQYPLSLKNLWVGYTDAVVQTFYGLDNLISQASTRQNFDGLDVMLVLLLVAVVGGCLIWRIKELRKDKPLLLAGGWQLLIFGAGWILISAAPLALLATTYGIDRRVLYTPAFGYALMFGGVIWGCYGLIKAALGSSRFWPLVAALILGLWLIYTPLNKDNLRVQKNYAPFSEQTLKWDAWILSKPEWVAKIPPAQVSFLEQKLKP